MYGPVITTTNGIFNERKAVYSIFLLIALPAFDFCDLPWSVALSVVCDGNNDAQF